MKRVGSAKSTHSMCNLRPRREMALHTMPHKTTARCQVLSGRHDIARTCRVVRLSFSHVMVARPPLGLFIQVEGHNPRSRFGKACRGAFEPWPPARAPAEAPRLNDDNKGSGEVVVV